jgi:anti-anti-sigma factor
MSAATAAPRHEARASEVCCVRASGHIGWGADTQIRDSLKATAGAAWAASPVVINLADVSFIDSAGISSLLAVHRELRGGGGRLVLCDVPPIIGQTFEVVGLSRLIPVAQDMHGAREMLSA